MPRKSKNFMDQFERARKEILALKKAMPRIFPEWQALQTAEDRMAAAKCELDLAKQAWKDLGKKK